MDITTDLLDDIYSEVKKHNSELDENSVPYANDIIRDICSDSGATDVIVKEALQILVDSHKIFSIEIVASDEMHSVDKIEGYVIAEYEVLHSLLNYYQEQLQIAYRKQFKVDLGIHRIVKEIFPQMARLNNTEIGKIANKAIMLNEYARLIDKEYQLYTEEWQQKKLKEILDQMGVGKAVKKDETEEVIESDSVSKESPEAMRAVDSKEYNSYSDKKKSYPLQRVLSIYGLDFFLKVNFRKYEFDYLIKIVKDRQISSRADLMKMKDMLRKVKLNIYKDPKLKVFEDKVYDLERVVSHALYFTK